MRLLAAVCEFIGDGYALQPCTVATGINGHCVDPKYPHSGVLGNRNVYTKKEGTVATGINGHCSNETLKTLMARFDNCYN